MDKNAFKERAKAHWADRGTESTHIAEWDATIFFKAPNFATIKAVTAESKGDPIEYAARMVVACAMDEHGEKIWSKPEYKDLMTMVDPQIILRIFKEIVKDAKLNLSAEELAADEKN